MSPLAHPLQQQQKQQQQQTVKRAIPGSCRWPKQAPGSLFEKDTVFVFSYWNFV